MNIKWNVWDPLQKNQRSVCVCGVVAQNIIYLPRKLVLFILSNPTTQVLRTIFKKIQHKDTHEKEKLPLFPPKKKSKSKKKRNCFPCKLYFHVFFSLLSYTTCPPCQCRVYKSVLWILYPCPCRLFSFCTFRSPFSKMKKRVLANLAFLSNSFTVLLGSPGVLRSSNMTRGYWDNAWGRFGNPSDNSPSFKKKKRKLKKELFSM